MNKFALPVYVVFAVVCGIDNMDTLKGVRAAYTRNQTVMEWAAQVDGAETSVYMFDGRTWYYYLSGRDIFTSVAVTTIPQCALTHDKVGQMMFA